MKQLLFFLLFVCLVTSFTQSKITWVAIGDSITYLNEHRDETGERITKGYMTRVVEKLPGIHYVNQGGDSSMRFAKIIPEPGRPANHVLHFWLKEPNVGGSKGRIQGNLYGNNGLKEFYQSVRIFLHDDFKSVRTFPKTIHWLTLAEFWNNITWSQTVPYRFRITLGIGKPVAAESDLYFILDAEDCELFPDDRQRYSTVWAETNTDVKVPIGKWFTMEYYYKEGNNETGRFYMTITPDNEPSKVIFDVRKITHNTQDPKPDGVSDFNPIKLYTSKELIEYMKSNGKVLQMYWDDFKLWKDKRP